MSRFSHIGDDSYTNLPRRSGSLPVYIGIAAIACGAMIAVYLSARPLIHKWRYERDLRKAEQYESANDIRSALLTLEQVSRLHPKDAEAKRRLAAFYERLGQIESVNIWHEAVALDPSAVSSRIGYARAALRYGELEMARDALEAIELSERSSTEYLRLRAALALLERDFDAQEKYLAGLLALEPTDGRVRLNLAAVQLMNPHGPRATTARLAMLELARQDRVRMRAVVELLNDVARRWPTFAPERDAELRRLAGELAPAKGPLLVMPSQVDNVERLVQFAMGQPRPEAEDVVSLTNWMSLNGQTESALQWIDTLKAPLRDNPLLRTMQAEFAIRIRDWERLRLMLLAGAWGPVPTESIESVFRAHGRADGAQGAWQTAIDAARSSLPGLRALLRLAELWQLPAEYRQVLIAGARVMPHETRAWRQLVAQAVARGDSEQVWQTYQEWHRVVPGDHTIQVESAIMGYLLGRWPVPGVAETAGYIEAQPGEIATVVAHALALRAAGRTREAMTVLDARPMTAFTEPRHALVRAILASETDRKDESEQLLRRLDSGLLLPEERMLAAQARERNAATR